MPSTADRITRWRPPTRLLMQDRFRHSHLTAHIQHNRQLCMSLRLRQAVPGRPSRHSSQNVSTVTTNNEVYIVCPAYDPVHALPPSQAYSQLYTSSSNVVLLDSRLELRETLLFWSALPQRASSSTLPDVQGVLGNEKDGLVCMQR